MTHKRILKLTAFIFAGTCLLAFIYSQFSNTLIVNNLKEYGLLVSFILATLFLGLEVFVLISVSIENVSLITLFTSLLYGFLFQFIPRTPLTEKILAPSILLFIFLLVWGFCHKNILKTVLRFIILSIIISSYQIVCMLLKFGFLQFQSFDMTDGQRIMFQIDYLCILLLIFMIGGALKNEKGESFVRGLELHIFPSSRKQTPRDGSHSSTEGRNYTEDYKRLTGVTKMIAGIVKIGYQCVQWALVLFICALGSVFLNGFVLSIAFVCYGLIFVKRWHPKTLIACTALTVALFYITATLLPEFKVSWFFPTLAALGLIYILYRIGLRQDEFKAIEQQLDAITNFNPDTATYEELDERCREIGMTESEITFCRQVFKSGLTHSQLAENMHITPQAIRKRKKRMRIRLSQK